MTATTIPWPQVNNEEGQRGVVRVSNLAYSFLLPLGRGLLRLHHRAAARVRTLSGEAVMLLQLACVLVVAIFFFGDPRVRSTYDVFGLALLAACIVDLFGLKDSRKKRAE